MTEQEEILCILQEECAEVSQVVCKIRRFGIDNMYTKGSGTQRENLTKELGDLQCMIDLCIDYGVVEKADVDLAVLNKQEKLKEFSNLYRD